MEYPSKRQKVSRILGRSYIHGYSRINKETREASPPNGDNTDHGDDDPAQGVQGRSDADTNTGYPTSAPQQPPVSHAAESTKTVIASVVQVIIDNGSSAIAELIVPAVSTVLPPTVVPFPSYGPVTVPVEPSFPTVPAAALPSVPWQSFPSGVAATDSMSILISGSSSEVVLSSPPPTPVPSSPAASYLFSPSVTGRPNPGAGNSTSEPFPTDRSFDVD